MGRDLRPFVRVVLYWTIPVAAMDGIVFLLFPELVESSAYQLADFFPGPVWGVIFLTVAVLCGIGLWRDAAVIIRVGVAIHALAVSVFGFSILSLTLSGATSAITGATKWWTFLFLHAATLRLRTLTQPKEQDENLWL